MACIFKEANFWVLKRKCLLGLASACRKESLYRMHFVIGPEEAVCRISNMGTRREADFTPTYCPMLEERDLGLEEHFWVAFKMTSQPASTYRFHSFSHFLSHPTSADRSYKVFMFNCCASLPLFASISCCWNNGSQQSLVGEINLDYQPRQRQLMIDWV